MAKRLPDAATNAARWVEGMSRASTLQKYKEGIANLDFNPMERAANASDAYIAGCQNGDAKRKRKLLETSQAKWTAACMAKSGRLAEGARAGKDNFQAASAKLLPVIQQIRSMLPQGTSKAVRRERMIAFSDAMERYGQSGSI